MVSEAPSAGASKVMLEVPWPAVIAPLETDQVYVTPEACSGTLAALPVLPRSRLAGADTCGVARPASTLMLALPTLEVAPAALVTWQVRYSVPTPPEVKVTVAVPWPAVMAPPVIVHAYVEPALCAGTDAVRPALLLLTVAGALISGAIGASTTVTLALPGR